MKLPRFNCITNITNRTITQRKLDFEECINSFSSHLEANLSITLIIMTWIQTLSLVKHIAFTNNKMKLNNIVTALTMLNKVLCIYTEIQLTCNFSLFIKILMDLWMQTTDVGGLCCIWNTTNQLSFTRQESLASCHDFYWPWLGDLAHCLGSISVCSFIDSANHMHNWHNFLDKLIVLKWGISDGKTNFIVNSYKINAQNNVNITADWPMDFPSCVDQLSLSTHWFFKVNQN